MSRRNLQSSKMIGKAIFEKSWLQQTKNSFQEISCNFAITRVKTPVVDHASVVDYFSEKHEKYGF